MTTIVKVSVPESASWAVKVVLQEIGTAENKIKLELLKPGQSVQFTLHSGLKITEIKEI
jgi:hypothetical protein